VGELSVRHAPVRRRTGLAREHPAMAPIAAVGIDEQLTALGPAWSVCRAVRPGVRVPRLDFVVVGPAGVFVVEVVDRPSARVWVRGENLVVDGAWVPQLTDSRRGAEALARVLSTARSRRVVVRPLVALATDPARCAIQRQPRGAFVVAPGVLGAWLSARPERLPAREVDALHACLDDAGTWARRAG
jgi:hypothetical protein